MKEPTGFESARRKAAAYSHDVKKTVELLNEASVKAEKEKTKVEKVWNELGMLIKMIRAWTRFAFNSLRKDIEHFAEWDKLTRNEEDFISI